MAIGIITADTHGGITDLEDLRKMKEEIERCGEISFFCIAGDIGEPFTMMANTFDIFSSLRCRKFYILGNHDLYRSSLPLYARELSLFEQVKAIDAMAAEFSFSNLEESGPFYCGNTAIIGCTAWADGSLNSHLFTERARMESRSQLLDHRQIAHSVKTLAEWSESSLHESVGEAMKNSEKGILITHYPIFGKQYSPIFVDLHGEKKPYPSDSWFHAPKIGEMVLSMNARKKFRIEKVFSGHTHHPSLFEIEGIRSEVLGADYNKPSFVRVEI